MVANDCLVETDVVLFGTVRFKVNGVADCWCFLIGCKWCCRYFCFS